MPSIVPTEAEVRAFAKSIGAIDDKGKYTQPLRKLQIGAIALRDELTDLPEEPESESTATQLSRFSDELTDETFNQELVAQIVLAVAPALVRSQGLQLKLKGTRTDG